MPQGDVFDSAAKFRAELMAGDRAAADRLIARYGRAWVAIQTDLNEVTAKIAAARALGQTPSPAWLYQEGRWRALRAQIEGEIRVFSRQASLVTLDAQRTAVDMALNHSQVLVEQAIEGAGVDAAFTSTSTDAAHQLIGHGSDGSPLRDLYASLGDDAALRIENALVSGIIAGLGPREIAREVRNAMGGNLARALTISRTETLRAYREATRQTYAENADVLSGWWWQADPSARTCAACWGMSGTFHDLQESLDGHPNCRCAMIPGVEGGPRPHDGEALFARQPESVQRAVLGPAKFDAYRDGRITLPDLVRQSYDPRWGSMRTERSLRSALARRAGVAESATASVAPAARTVGRVVMTDDVVSALAPARTWSPELRDSARAALHNAENGEILFDTLDRFQDGGSIARLRTNVDKRLAGTPIDATSTARVDALLDALDEVPTDWAPETLFRGMSVKGRLETVLARYTPGDTIDLNLTSFSADRKIGTKFAANLHKQGNTRVMVEWVGGDKRAIPIQNIARDRRLFPEKEWVTGGRFRIVEAKKGPSGNVILRVEQIGGLR